jgi:predicted nucleic acid-binding protein
MHADGPVFVDTNVLVYAFDEGETVRREKAGRLLEELMGADRLRLSAQVLQELFVTMTRKAARPWTVADAVGVLDDLAAWPVLSPDYPAIRDAALLSRDATISFWDALVVIAAARSGAEVLYTEDLNHGQTIAGVRVVDPFR